MGVIPERKAVVCDGDEPVAEVVVVDNEESDPEDLDVEHDNFPVVPRQNLQDRIEAQSARLRGLEHIPSCNENAGRKKEKRFRNLVRILGITIDEDGSYIHTQLIEPYKGPFQRLMEYTDNPLHLLKTCLANLEEKENQKLDNLINNKFRDSAFLHISRKIRKAMHTKKNFPAPEFRQIEKRMIDSFTINPKRLFTYVPLTSFERLFIHGLAQYHNLMSVNTRSNGLMYVEVWNAKTEWSPIDCRLCDLMQERKL